MIAALLILARQYLRRYDLPHPSTAEILTATKATKSRAYELAARLLDVLGDVTRPVGRPAAPAAQPPPDASAAISGDLLRFLMANPGAAGPRFYTGVFKKKVLEMRDAHADLDLGTFANAVAVPRGTIEDWLRPGRPHAVVATSSECGSCEDEPAASTRIQSILAAKRSWRGTFAAFCDHVRNHLRIDYGRRLIARILYTYGERTPVRRTGRSPDECATKGSFEVYFPGAQWVGDGMQVPVVVNGERFDFNLELDVDASSGAIVGASIRDEEDGPAVVEAFQDGVETAGAPPIALLLDNRPSNHTEEVDAALGDTIRMRSTPGRGQSKAHVEGAFGLFSQDAPPLVVHARTLRHLAREILRLRVQTWARTLNHRPRADRDGNSRIDLHHDSSPTPQQIAQARSELEDRRQKQEKARATRLARSDPIVRQILDAAFERLGLLDPDEHVRSAIAAYTRDALVDGIAIFEGKKKAGTLPDGVDGRYLLGIVKNVEHVHESNAITEALIRERLTLRDQLLGELVRERDALARTHTIDGDLSALVDRAMGATRMIDRHFWLVAMGDRIAERPPDEQANHFRATARRIHATFAVPRADRFAAERIVARQVWPIS